MDTRMYRQENLIQHYSRQDKSVSPDGPLARCARGPMGLFAAAAAVSGVFTGLAYAFVCLKAWAGAFAVGSVAQYVSAITALSSNVSALVATWGDFRSNAVFLRTTYEFLDIPNTMYQGSLTTEKRSDRHYEIEFRDVSFRYPNTETWALRHVNMKFQVGSRLAVGGKTARARPRSSSCCAACTTPPRGKSF